MPGIGGITINDEFSSEVVGNGNGGFLWKGKSPNNSTSKEATVGSLSFKVINTSSPKKSNELSRQAATKDAGSSVKVPQKSATRKPVARAKVPFEKGYSQMDWLKLTQTHPDLAGIELRGSCIIIIILDKIPQYIFVNVWCSFSTSCGISLIFYCVWCHPIHEVYLWLNNCLNK